MPSNSITGAIEQWLKNKGKKFTKALGVGLFVAAACIDVALNVTLREVPAFVTAGHNDSDAWVVEVDIEDYSVSWKWHDLVHNLTDFSGDTVDVLLLAAVRILLLAVLLQLGVWLGTCA